MPSVIASRYAGAYPGQTRAFIVTSNTTNGAATLTADSVVNAVLIRNSATAPFSDTLPAAAVMLAPIGADIQVGTAFDFIVENKSADTMTLLAGTGITIAGAATIAANTGRSWVGIVTAAPIASTLAITLYPNGAWGSVT